MTGSGRKNNQVAGGTNDETKMRLDQLYIRRDRGIESIQSGLLLFGFTILLALFMGAVVFLNGTG